MRSRRDLQKMGQTELNPYDPPSRSDEAGALAERGFWRDGDYLVVRRGHNLPDRCVLCNEPADGRRFSFTLAKIKGFWSGVGANASATIRIGLGRKHFRGRRFVPYVRWITWLPQPAVGGISLIAMGAITRFYRNFGEGIAVVAAVFFSWLAAKIYILRADDFPLVPAQIDRRFVWVQGVSPAYLALAPAIPQAESEDEHAD